MKRVGIIASIAVVCLSLAALSVRGELPIGFGECAQACHMDASWK